MKRIVTAKSKAIAIFICIPSVMLIAFQNFTPRLSVKPSDVSDLYMNSALSTALKTKEEKNKSQDMAAHREVSWEDDSAQNQEPTDDREPTNEEPASKDE